MSDSRTRSRSSTTTSTVGNGEKDESQSQFNNAKVSRRAAEEKEFEHGDVLSKETNIAGDASARNPPNNLHHTSTHNSITRAISATVDPEKTAENTTASVDDPNVVWWDGPSDPSNPMNFKSSLKILNITIVSAICFVTPLASSMLAPGIPNVMREFNTTSTELGSFAVSVYVLGFAIGPLAFAPLSELYGRLPIYHICNVCFLACTIACALATNLNMLIGFRFLAGMFGAAPLTNGGGTIADLIEQAKRGKAMSGFVMGPIVGPIIGPVAGGYLTQSLGWRWCFWIITIVSGLITVMGFIWLRETYAPVILHQRTLKLRKETNNPLLVSKLDSGLSPKDFFLRSIIRPVRLLVFSPIVFSTSLYVGVVYSYMYLMFTTFPLVFQGTYGFSSGSVGLTYLGLGVGSLTGTVLFGITSDRAMKAAAAEAKERETSNISTAPALIQPELRLPPMIYAAPLIPIGLIIYAWTTDYAVHWIVPIIATGLVGLGNLMVFMCISTYLLDAFSIYAASALAAATVIRSVMGAVLPLFGQRMYLSLGLGWGSTLLALVAFVLLPVPVVIHRYGEWIRKRWEIKDL